MNKLSHAAHLVLFHPPSGERGRTDADTRGHEGRARVEGDGVLIDRDTRFIEDVLRLFAAHVLHGEVQEEVVVVRPTRDDAVAFFLKGARQGSRAFLTICCA